MSENRRIYIKQDQDSASVTIACRLVTDDDPQIQLVPSEWVKVATCAPGQHVLRVGTVINRGGQKVTLSLRGCTHNGSDEILDLFYAPTDGNRYEIEVQ